MVRIPGFLCHGPGSISGQELRSYKPHDVAKPGKKKEINNIVNQFSKSIEKLKKEDS